MASDLKFIQYICDQLHGIKQISFRKMFGEYAIYHNNKVVALVCDNQLFIKPTASGRNLITELTEAPPYPGAKPYFLMNDRMDDHELLRTIIIATSNELPEPKPKKPKTNKNAATRK